MLSSSSDGLECDGELWAILMVGLAIVEVGVVCGWLVELGVVGTIQNAKVWGWCVWCV